VLRPTRTGLAALALAAPVLAGCGLSPAQTTVPYQPSDGVSAQVGDVQVRNLLVVGSTADAPGVLSGVLVNGGTEQATVTLAAEGGQPVPVDVPPGQSVQLGVQNPSAPMLPSPQSTTTTYAQLSPVGQPAGAVVPITLSSAAGGSTTVKVPVLAATNEYATLTPTSAPTGSPTLTQGPAPMTPTPSATPSGTPSATPSASPTSS
jgi:hypothetical protein